MTIDKSNSFTLQLKDLCSRHSLDGSTDHSLTTASYLIPTQSDDGGNEDDDIKQESEMDLPVSVDNVRKQLHTRKCARRSHVVCGRAVHKVFCAMCGQGCASQSALMRHERVHKKSRKSKSVLGKAEGVSENGADVVQGDDAVDKGGDERKYACLYCSRTFSAECVLQHHIVTHTGQSGFYI